MPQVDEPTIFIEDPTDASVTNPYLYLPLFADDDGRIAGRTLKAEWISRRPACVSWTPDAVDLTIMNSGDVGSDLVRVDFQFVYCALAGHRVDEGFTVEHFLEIDASTVEDVLSVTFVPARSSVKMRIRYPQAPAGCANLYFRARVCTLWSPVVPMSEWSFADDPSVTEATLRLV